MVNVDYLQVLIGLSLDVAMGQKVALVPMATSRLRPINTCK